MKIIQKINVAKYIAKHLVGENHTNLHRRFFGVIIMVLGVLLMHSMKGPIIMEVLIDTIGTSMHGIGLIPFVSSIEKTV